jgi:LacI family transcriptional regulator
MARIRHRVRKVALLVEWSRIYGRGVLRGIGKYVAAHGRWKVYHTERGLSDGAPSWLRHWKGDGIIARIENRKLTSQIKQLGVPVVDLFEHEDMGKWPAVLTDNRVIARLAAEHLLERGLRHFAYCGLPGIFSSDDRCGHFVRFLKERGFAAAVYDPPRRHRKEQIAASEDIELQYEESVAEWLRSLPKPLGLMACNDLRAHQILMACNDIDVAVPEEVAVIGVDNDEVVCELSQPPLSSIEQNPEEAGYQGAALLDRLMDGQSPPAEESLVEPRGVVARQSTDIVAAADGDVAAALRFIREHACDGIGVHDLLTHVPLSRRTLERRFLDLLDRTPREEIVRVQIGHVKRLLTMTAHPLARIAELTGFRYVESMCVLFKNATGMTPGQYRREPRS